MAFERRYTMVVGLATILSAYMYAVDNDWLVSVPEIRTALEETEKPSIPPIPLLNETREDPVASVTPEPARRIIRRTVNHRATKRSRPKKRYVNIFQDGKDIKVPTTSR